MDLLNRESVESFKVVFGILTTIIYPTSMSIVPVGSRNDVTLTDVDDEDLLDPSVNIVLTERTIERSRRASRRESEVCCAQTTSQTEQLLIPPPYKLHHYPNHHLTN